jgi:hypothetical protein
VLARAEGRFDAHVVFLGPPLSESDGPLSLRAQAAALPGVRLTEDPAEAARFVARTSGQVLVYDAHGQLAFQGGLTPSRGHEGANAGADALLRLTAAPATGAGASAPAPPPASPRVSAVFGCTLFTDEPR